MVLVSESTPDELSNENEHFCPDDDKDIFSNDNEDVRPNDDKDIFPHEDEDSLPEDLMFTLSKPEGKLGQYRWACGYIVNHPWGQTFVLVIIVLNCVVFGIGATDLVYNNPDADFWQNILEVIDFAFLLIFTAEITFQFIYHGLLLFKEPWLCFDLFLVVMSWFTENVSFFKALKLRGFRVLRTFRLFQVGPMYEMIQAMIQVFPKLSVITFFILMLLYVFAVLFTNLFKDISSDENYFTRLDTTLFTLLQMMTMDFAGPLRDTMATYPWAWVPFLCFLLVMGFLMFNLMIAVVCDAVGTMEMDGEESVPKSNTRQEARFKLYHLSDTLSNKVISQQKQIEENLLNLTDLLLKKEKFTEKDLKKFIEHINQVPKETEEIETIDPLPVFESRSEKTPEDEIFVPKGCMAKQRILCGNLVNHHHANRFILVCICLNCVLMGIDATFAFENEPAEQIVFIIDSCFLIIYTIESGMQLFYLSYKILQDSWLIFDILIVIFSWGLASFKVVRGFRVLRAVRVTARIGPLKDIVQGFCDSIQKLSAILLLSLLVFYIFAVLFTHLYKDSHLSEDYYTRLDFTMLTLLQMMTLDFAGPMRETMKEHPNAWAPHILFVLIMGLLFFNLMAGVICDAISDLNDETESKDVDEIPKLLYQLRCISYNVSIISKTKESFQARISNLSRILETKRKKLRSSNDDTNVS